MRQPTYTPRETLALEHADRIVARVLVDGDWRESELRPEPGQTLIDKLAEVQTAMASSTPLISSRIVLYVGGEVRGERMLAAVPREYIPDEVRTIVGDR